jgi:ectoine hydroxylase-related dioxygenase (phytanoyl-CoA dioxygenase family)
MPASGALKVWPGSHRRNIDMVSTASQGPVVPDDQASDADAVLLEAAAGSVLVWESSLVHASDPNHSDLPRRLLVLGFTAGAPV